MKRVFLLSLVFALASQNSFAQQDLRGTLFAEADQQLQEARNNDADILAPDSFTEGLESYRNADQDFERGRNIDRIRNQLREASRQFVQAIQASEIAAVTLASLIKTRDDAANADAETFAGDLWVDAEETFNAAARRLESGDIRGARARGQTAETLYRDAELTAIGAQYLSQTRALLARAEQLRVPRYAPTTYARAQDLLSQAESELADNRYDTDLPRSLAQQANYEARHAIYLAEQIELLRDDDISEEDIILRYEEPLTRIAAAADMVATFDQGTEPVARELVELIEELREEAQQLRVDISDSRTRIGELEDEIRELDEQLGGVSQERVALVQRLEAEARIRDQFVTIEALFTRDQARISREGNSIVLRLVGLTFESGRSTVDLSHRPLLEKVNDAAAIFPRAQIVIEGHTDSYGSDEENMALSRRRAESVSGFLTEQFSIPAFRIGAVGYGETRPIANNETPQGRIRNRRIEVRIDAELE